MFQPRLSLSPEKRCPIQKLYRRKSKRYSWLLNVFTTKRTPRSLFIPGRTSIGLPVVTRDQNRVCPSAAQRVNLLHVLPTVSPRSLPCVHCRAGQWALSYFWIFSIIKNDFIAFFIKWVSYFCISPINLIKKAKKHYLLVKKWKKTESDQLWCSVCMATAPQRFNWPSCWASEAGFLGRFCSFFR